MHFLPYYCVNQYLHSAALSTPSPCSLKNARKSLTAGVYLWCNVTDPTRPTKSGDQKSGNAGPECEASELRTAANPITPPLGRTNRKRV